MGMSNALLGRWKTRNNLLVAVHLNPAATVGNRVERYLGHVLETSKLVVTDAPGGPTEMIVSPVVVFCWNENGECVWKQGLEDKDSPYDLMEALIGDKWSKEREIKVESCKECNNVG